MTPLLDSSELKPLTCPFCVAPERGVEIHSEGGGVWVVVCDDCETRGPTASTSREAIAAWNRRVSPSAPIASEKRNAILAEARDAVRAIPTQGQSGVFSKLAVLDAIEGLMEVVESSRSLSGEGGETHNCGARGRALHDPACPACEAQRQPSSTPSKKDRE